VPPVGRNCSVKITPPVELTDRKLDVLRYLAQGLSNQEIADVLAISLYTVRSHVRNILNKLHRQSHTGRVVCNE
jgi:two-component system, NarL family, response regulator LiaR